MVAEDKLAAVTKCGSLEIKRQRSAVMPRLHGDYHLPSVQLAKLPWELRIPTDRLITVPLIMRQDQSGVIVNQVVCS